MNSRIATILLGAAWMGMPLASSFAADRYSPQNGYHGDLTLLTGPNVTSPAATKTGTSLGLREPQMKSPAEREKIRQLAVQTQLEQLRAKRDAIAAKARALEEARENTASSKSPPAKQPDAVSEPAPSPPPAPAPKP